MIKPECDRILDIKFKFEDYLDDYLKGITDQWLKIVPYANPALLEMFRDRDRRPLRYMVSSSGELAGKHLTGAVEVLRLTRDCELKALTKWFVDELIKLQDRDGYLGCWPKKYRFKNIAPNSPKTGSFKDCPVGETWDTWSHYHIMLGLLLWYEDTDDRKALSCAKKIADLICRKFLKAKKRLVDTPATMANLAPIHSLCLLYNKTGIKRYLDMALKIVDEFAAEGHDKKLLAGDFIRLASAGREFYESPQPRWESLHQIMGIAELYWITGNEVYRQTVEHLWWSMVKLDRHNNGGFSSAEQAVGNPYHQGAIETCCTIAWIDISMDMLRLTGNSIVADEIELSTLNSIIGAHSYTGRWVTYNTPMDGVRKAAVHAIGGWHGREGAPELSCCTVNGPRGFGMISEWSLMKYNEGLILNWYGSCTITTDVSSGVSVTLKQETEYPRKGRIILKVIPSQAEKFSLKLRIPFWSKKTKVKINGKYITGIIPGQYLTLYREWKRNDKVQIDLDMSFHYWAGEKECRGKVSIYRGPILLTYDRRFNDMDPYKIPVLDAAKTKGQLVKWKGWIPPILLLVVTGVNGRKVRLCDFGSAGECGSPYRSWLKVKNVRRVPFSQTNPLRSTRLRGK